MRGRLIVPRQSDGRPYWPHSPSAQQLAFLMYEGREAFYGGAAGGGKSDALLMAALQYVHVPSYRALILRRTFVELSKGDALIPRSHEWLSNTEARWNEQRKTWLFPSLATLEFGHVENENDKHAYQGAAWQFVGFDELTTFSETIYDYIAFSRSRRSLAAKAEGIPIRARSTGNPGGMGHEWVKARFVDSGTRKRGVVFIPAKVADNPGLDVAEYSESLSGLSEALRKQLLDGDWNAFEGLAFPDLREDVHFVPMLPRQTIDAWQRSEGMDHGVSAPTCWLLVATDYDSNRIVLDEYYSPGLPSMHAAEIIERRQMWWSLKDEDGRPIHHVCWGDPASLRESLPVDGKLGDPLTLSDEYRRFRIAIAPANNRRKAGYVRIRELLEPSCACSVERLGRDERCPTCQKTERRRFPLWHPRGGEPGSPRLFIVASRCPNLVAQLKVAPLLPIDSGKPDAGEAIDPKWEGPRGHAVATLRYVLLEGFSASREPEDKEPEDPRAAHHWRRKKEILRRIKAENRRQNTQLW